MIFPQTKAVPFKVQAKRTISIVTKRGRATFNGNPWW